MKHGCCWWESYDTSVWDVVPIKATEDLSFSLPLAFPMPLCLLITGESFEQSASEINYMPFSLKKTTDVLEICFWWLWKGERGRWKCTNVCQKLSNMDGCNWKVMMLIITDGDCEKEEVADDDRGDHVRWSCVFVHDCNKLSHYRLLCLTAESYTLSCQSFSGCVHRFWSCTAESEKKTMQLVTSWTENAATKLQKCI